ncbi:alpha/beta fold hydrolase [Cupriavidus basilensis]|uniref:alpha/beta fold hydrolase n=1 Tax=Cupriavidus basilensis TaxID=68895 RepID=UPI001184E466
MARTGRIPQELPGVGKLRCRAAIENLWGGLVVRPGAGKRVVLAIEGRVPRWPGAALLLEGWRVPRTGANFCRVIASPLDAASHKNRRSVSLGRSCPGARGRDLADELQPGHASGSGWRTCGAALFARQSDATLTRRDHWGTLASVEVPALWIWGAADTFVPAEVGGRIAGVLPDARYEVLPGCGHFPSMERPEASTAIAREWLLDRFRGRN